jgi:hypothetical protein
MNINPKRMLNAFDLLLSSKPSATFGFIFSHLICRVKVENSALINKLALRCIPSGVCLAGILLSCRENNLLI